MSVYSILNEHRAEDHSRHGIPHYEVLTCEHLGTYLVQGRDRARGKGVNWLWGASVQMPSGSRGGSRYSILPALKETRLDVTYSQHNQ